MHLSNGGRFIFRKSKKYKHYDTLFSLQNLIIWKKKKKCDELGELKNIKPIMKNIKRNKLVYN